ncbi:MAG: PEP/pyruvate-binding domain-containing protein [Solirubrobacterales bacterium]|nr:PEP/pyruvate-binding domain-containing protein [Solirubrobacterales bacterium]MBV9534985.1 PEP/pyruvate-binding domain-containing protein [Solirubrobacterales bacterium]
MTGAVHIRWFQECNASSTREVGGKCASLGDLIGAGLSVPPGFAVTTTAHELFLQSSDVRGREAELLASVDYESLPQVTAASQELRSMVDRAELPPSTAGAVRAAYGELCGEEGADVPVAVRSSAGAEDLAGASFAGQLETYLWVEGADAVLEHVRRCWGGFFTPEALTYRHRQKVDSADELMSVGVQRMVRARSAGVMFTLNPVNGDRSKVVIESTWGLGEPLVAGEVDPDRFVVDKVMLEVLEKSVSEKLIEHRPDLARRRVVVADVEEGRRSAASLSDAEAVELARLGKTIERHYGIPQDVEWAIDADSGSLVVLQARHETVWSRRERRPTVQKKGSALEYVLADLLKR